VSEDVPSNDEPELDRSARLPLAYLQQNYLDMVVRPPFGEDMVEGESCSAELAIYPPMTNTVPDAPFIGPDQMLIYMASKLSGTRRMVTQRDDDDLQSRGDTPAVVTS
jgi:hypothetical protein